MASWLAEPFFLLSLSVAAAAPVKNHFLLLNPKRAIPVGKIASNIFLIFYRLQQKHPFYPFCSSRILLFRCIFWFHLVFSGSPMYFVFKVPYGSPFRAPGRITLFFTRCNLFYFYFLPRCTFIYLGAHFFYLGAPLFI